MTIHVSPPQPARRRVWTKAWTALRRAREVLLGGVILACTGILIASLWHLASLNRQNALIAKLEAGEDVGAESRDDRVRLARAAFLLARDRFDDAQAILDAAKTTARPAVMSAMLYNQANANVRRAFAAIEASRPDAAIPLIKLAKDAYREALRLEPAAWNVKHNYDVATRLMRDFPGHEQDGEEVPPDAELKLWTDLPGVPQGAP